MTPKYTIHGDDDEAKAIIDHVEESDVEATYTVHDYNADVIVVLGTHLDYDPCDPVTRVLDVDASLARKRSATLNALSSYTESPDVDEDGYITYAEALQQNAGDIE